MLITMPAPIDGLSRRRPDPARLARRAARAGVDRVLVVGNGPGGEWSGFADFGVVAEELSVRLSALRGRPSIVDVVTARTMLMGGVIASLPRATLTMYDGVLVVLGADDAARRTPPGEWERSLRAFLRVLEDAAPSAEVVVAPAEAASPWAAPQADSLDFHARLLNRVTRRVTAEFARVRYAEDPRGAAMKSAAARRHVPVRAVPYLAPRSIDVLL